MIEFIWNENKLEFNTTEKVFSPTAVDKGTLAMLSITQFQQEDKVLDLGCGYGVVGVTAARIIGSENVVLCDISEDAVALAKENALLNHVEKLSIYVSDGLKSLTEDNFTLILSNPPYHVDFKVPKEFIEDSYKKLAVGGKLRMVTKRKDWYKNKLIAVFGGVKIDEINGYFVFTAEKRSVKVGRVKSKDKENKLSKKLSRKQKSKLTNKA